MPELRSKSFFLCFFAGNSSQKSVETSILVTWLILDIHTRTHTQTKSLHPKNGSFPVGKAYFQVSFISFREGISALRNSRPANKVQELGHVTVSWLSTWYAYCKISYKCYVYVTYISIYIYAHMYIYIYHIANLCPRFFQGFSGWWNIPSHPDNNGYMDMVSMYADCGQLAIVSSISRWVYSNIFDFYNEIWLKKASRRKRRGDIILHPSACRSLPEL